MTSFKPNIPNQKSVAKTNTIIFRILLSIGIGLYLIVSGVFRIKDFDSINLTSMIMPLIGVFLFVVGFISCRDLPAARILDTRGEIVPGEIISKWTKSDSEGDRNCFVAYKYGQGQEAYQKISWKCYQLIDSGDRISVRYLSEDPTMSRLEGEWYR